MIENLWINIEHELILKVGDISAVKQVGNDAQILLTNGKTIELRDYDIDNLWQSIKKWSVK